MKVAILASQSAGTYHHVFHHADEPRGDTDAFCRFFSIVSCRHAYLNFTSDIEWLNRRSKSIFADFTTGSASHRLHNFPPECCLLRSISTRLRESLGIPLHLLAMLVSVLIISACTVNLSLYPYRDLYVFARAPSPTRCDAETLLISLLSERARWAAIITRTKLKVNRAV